MFVAALCAVLSKAHLSPGLVGFSVSAALQVLQTPPNLGSRLWAECTQTPARGPSMATHSSVLTWRIPGTGEPVGCHLWGRTESDTTKAT